MTAFRKELLASAFAPSPPGLYNPDCFRIYEAMFAGAIPIIPRHFQFEPLGDHPIPMVTSWYAQDTTATNQPKLPPCCHSLSPLTTGASCPRPSNGWKPKALTLCNSASSPGGTALLPDCRQR